MTTSDYGPVPMAQFKDRSGEVYAALDEGRRVLLSRHGRVIASIDPATVAQHAPLLASYALHGSSIAELSPKTIGQGSPARVLRSVQEGATALVTRDSKVYGVISMFPIVQMTFSDAEREEQQLAAFEREHPGAGPEEFARFSESLADAPATGAMDAPNANDSGLDLVAGDVATFPAPLVADLAAEAMRVKGVALERTRDYTGAEKTLQSAIDELDSLYRRDRRSRAKAAQLLVELSKVYVADDRPEEAVTVADEAVRRIRELGA